MKTLDTARFGRVTLVELGQLGPYSRRGAMRLVRIVSADYPEGVWVRKYQLARAAGGGR